MFPACLSTLDPSTLSSKRATDLQLRTVSLPCEVKLCWVSSHASSIACGALAEDAFSVLGAGIASHWKVEMMGRVAGPFGLKKETVVDCRA